MSVYIPGEPPFWAARNVTQNVSQNSNKNDKEKLVYQLPEMMKRDRIVHCEIKELTHRINLGGFDGNGNVWVSQHPGKLVD